MMTEAGKIQGHLLGRSVRLNGYHHRWANLRREESRRPSRSFGHRRVPAPTWQEFKRLEPNVFVDQHEPLPEALRVGRTRPAQRRSEPRGVHLHSAGVPALSSCRKRSAGARRLPRHWLCLRATRRTAMRGSTREAIPTVSRATNPGICWCIPSRDAQSRRSRCIETTYSGIPVETCTTCHDRGKRIGVSFPGPDGVALHVPLRRPTAATSRRSTRSTTSRWSRTFTTRRG